MLLLVVGVERSPVSFHRRRRAEGETPSPSLRKVLSSSILSLSSSHLAKHGRTSRPRRWPAVGSIAVEDADAVESNGGMDIERNHRRCSRPLAAALRLELQFFYADHAVAS